MSETGWFSDPDPERAGDGRFIWRPFLQLRGFVSALDTWFASKADCDHFIRTEVIGQEFHP